MAQSIRYIQRFGVKINVYDLGKKSMCIYVYICIHTGVYVYMSCNLVNELFA